MSEREETAITGEDVAVEEVARDDEGFAPKMIGVFMGEFVTFASSDFFHVTKQMNIDEPFLAYLDS